MVGLLKKEGRVGFGFYKKVCHSLAGEGGIEAFKKLKTFLVFSPFPFFRGQSYGCSLIRP